MRGYQEFVLRQKQNSKPQQRRQSNKSPSIQNFFSHRQNKNQSGTPNKSPQDRYQTVKTSRQKFYPKPERPNRDPSNSHSVSQVASQNARLTQQRESLFKKNCELVNEINKIKKQSRVKTLPRIPSVNSRNCVSAKCYQNPTDEKQQMEECKYESQKIISMNRRNNERSQCLSQVEGANQYKKIAQNLQSLKLMKHISTPVANKDSTSHSSKNLITTHKKVSTYTKGDASRLNAQYSDSGSEQQFYLAEKTTPIPDNSSDIFDLMKNKSHKCLSSNKKKISTIPTKSNYETTSSYKKTSVQRQTQYMLVKMCDHCVEDLTASKTNQHHLISNCERNLQNSTYESQETVSNVCTPRSQKPVSKKRDFTNVAAQRSSTIAQLQLKIRRIKAENERLRSEICIQ